jgi:multisubunit Na+/H+ antiporter MnhE subunit
MHALLLILLFAFGVWVMIKDLLPPAQGGFSFFDGIIGAMYWFAFFLYALLSTILYFSLRRYSWGTLMIAHIFSLFIAATCTVALITLGQQQAIREGYLESSSTEAVPLQFPNHQSEAWEPRASDKKFQKSP